MVNPRTTVLNIETIYPISKQVARIVASTNTVETSKAYDDLLVDRYEGQVRIISNTFKDISTHYSNMITCCVALERKSKELNAENLANHKAITANVFSDDENNIWKVVDLGSGNKRLVQTSEDDIESLLNERRMRQSRKLTASFSPSVDFQNGDYVLYVNAETASVHDGVGIVSEGRYYVVDRITKKQVEVSDDTFVIAEAFEDDEGKVKPYDFKSWEVLSSLSAASAAKAIEYYKILYGNHLFYFDQLTTLIKNLVK